MLILKVIYNLKQAILDFIKKAFGRALKKFALSFARYKDYLLRTGIIPIGLIVAFSTI